GAEHQQNSREDQELPDRRRRLPGIRRRLGRPLLLHLPDLVGGTGVGAGRREATKLLRRAGLPRQHAGYQLIL
ncbi:MAG: hypothetical protein ACTSW0_09725, partial [Candidatus Heimdallarchaeota archaeon]